MVTPSPVGFNLLIKFFEVLPQYCVLQRNVWFGSEIFSYRFYCSVQFRRVRAVLGGVDCCQGFLQLLRSSWDGEFVADAVS